MMVGCQSGPEREPLKAIDRPIQLERFMGDWYVIAHIPAFIEADAFNGVESYRLDADGTIPTTYTFNDGGFDGPVLSSRASSVCALTTRRVRGVMRIQSPCRHTPPMLAGPSPPPGMRPWPAGYISK